PKERIPMHRRLPLHGPRHYATHPLKWETDSSALTITVDSFTTQFEQHHQRRDTAFPFSFIDSVSYHPANTVILRNRSDSTLVVGDRDFLQYIALEVKKENGEWVCLEKSAQNAYDPVGWVSFIYLNPGEILVAKFPRYAPGEVRQCRLAWR